MQENDFFLYEIGGAECNMGVSNNKTVEKIKTATERAVGPTDFGFGLMVVYKQILPRFPHFSLFTSLSKNLLSPLSNKQFWKKGKIEDEDSSSPTNNIAPARWPATLEWRRRRRSLAKHLRFQIFLHFQTSFFT